RQILLFAQVLDAEVVRIERSAKIAAYVEASPSHSDRCRRERFEGERRWVPGQQVSSMRRNSDGRRCCYDKSHANAPTHNPPPFISCFGKAYFATEAECCRRRETIVTAS